MLPRPFPLLRFQFARRGCRSTADVNLSLALAAAIAESLGMFRAATGSSPAPPSRHVPESRLRRLHQTLGVPSTSHRAQHQTPTRRYAYPPCDPSPAPAPCKPPFLESLPEARRSSMSVNRIRGHLAF